MTDFVQVIIGREELGIGFMYLTPSVGYYITRDGIGPGGVEWEKQHADSIFVDGSYMVARKKQMQVIPFSVWVKATSADQLHDRINVLTEALEQWEYYMTVTIDGIDYTWTCETADYEIGDGGAWQDLELRSYVQKVSAQIPRFPD